MSQPSFEPGQQPDGSGPIYYAEPPQKSRGCFFYGCIAALIVSGLGLLLVIASVGMLYYYANRYIQEYTETAPVALPVVEISEEQRQSAIERWDAFRKALDEGKEAELVLTSDEVNVLIEREPKLKGKVFCKLNGEEINGQVSIPLGETGLPLVSGRYLNGSATFTAEIDEDGDLDIRLRDIEVKGKKLPAEAKAQLANENLARQFVQDPDNRRMVRKIKSIKVKDSKVYLKSRDMTKEKEKDEDTPDTDKEKDKDATKPDDDAPKSDADAAKKDDPSKADTPKDEPVKADAPKADAPKSDAPKEEPTKVEAPKAEPPKADTPKAEPPKGEQATVAGRGRLAA